MRLTAALGTIKRELFKGNMFRGKYRYVKPVKQKDMKELEEEYKREERVMKLLLKPYLTLEESSGHSKVMNKQERKFSEVMEKRRLMKLKPNITIEDRLVHLNVKDVWD